MVYHFKQTIVVKREQEIPNYTVQRTMIRKTTPAHEAQGAHELSQFGWKIKSKHTHVVISLVFFLPPSTPFYPLGPGARQERNLRV